MKRVLLIFLAIIAVQGCKKKEETNFEATGSGVQTLQDTSQLEAQYKDVLAKDPKNHEAIIALGNLYFDSGQAPKAVEMYQKALEIKPNDANVLTDMGTMFRNMGNFDKAIEVFRQAASVDPTHEQSRYNLGVVLYADKKDMKGAADAWEDLLRANPNHPNALELKQTINQIRNPQQTSEQKSPSEGWVNKK